MKRQEHLVERFVNAWYDFASVVRKEMGRDLILFPQERSLGRTLPRSWQRQTWDRALRRRAVVVSPRP
jgi:hypothetical protein